MKKILLTLVAVASLMGVMTLTSDVAFAGPADQIQKGVNAVDDNGKGTSLGDSIQIVVNILLYILGAIAVLMIVIGGIRYTTSNGDSSQIKGAKDTILYSVVGLVVAIMAYAIVNFVLKAFI